MGSNCTACRHPKRSAIDGLIVKDVSVADIAKEFAISRFAITRHKQHVVELIAKSPRVEEIAAADSIIDEIMELQALMRTTLDRAIKDKDNTTMFAAFDRLVNILKLRSAISGELKPRQQTNTFISIHSGGQKGFHDQLEQLVERARLFQPDRRGAGEALQIDAGG